MHKLTCATFLMLLMSAPAGATSIVDDEDANDAIATAGIQLPRDATPTAHIGVLSLQPSDIDFIGVGPLGVGDVLTVMTIPVESNFDDPDTQLAIFDAAGNRVVFNDDDSAGGGGLGSAIRFEVPSDGEYFVGVTGFNDPTFEGLHSQSGSYGLTIALLPVALANTPPDCETASATPGEIWPPNRSLVDVAVEGVTDPDGDPVALAITSIYQDEPISGGPASDVCGDGAGVGGEIASVRAAFDGSGDGRVYSIEFTAMDGNGGACSGSVAVCVPHDQRPDSTCVDQGPLYDSTNCEDA